MGPWANRLDEPAFYANGRRHAFDMTLGDIRGDVPIHGFVTTTSLWRVAALRATGNEALVTSRLDFYRQPAWMRQWPYAHTVEITYRLVDGVLEVATAIANLSDDPLPVAIGFHPYFQLTDSPPMERNFICLEPMAAVTNALNLAQRRQYRELQTIPPGGTRQESFWVKPSGFTAVR